MGDEETVSNLTDAFVYEMIQTPREIMVLVSIKTARKNLGMRQGGNNQLVPRLFNDDINDFKYLRAITNLAKVVVE
ncbi:hypothetical protein [Nitrosomonas sp.]|uniref:hypothetical protein n=1 Tax=Nitrosomonas sp. TaxID=42353 RepID=UPI001D4B2FCB|nr:hypothetical protein [Nitrosomonas sp.]MCB1948515.1 hypothetical protein [Nitrosomonas sp.]